MNLTLPLLLICAGIIFAGAEGKKKERKNIGNKKDIQDRLDKINARRARKQGVNLQDDTDVRVADQVVYGDLKPNDNLLDMMEAEDAQEERGNGNKHERVKRSGCGCTPIAKRSLEAFIDSAVAEISAKVDGCIKFEKLSAPGTAANGNGNYVNVMNGGYGACYSTLGYDGYGKQDLSLGSGCMFLNMNWGGIDSNYCTAFRKCQGCQTVTPYDPKSVMHYPSAGFGCNGADSFTLKDGTTLGWNLELTTNDIKNVKTMYGCL